MPAKNKLSVDVSLSRGEVLVLKIGLYGCWESRNWRHCKGTKWHHFQ